MPDNIYPDLSNDRFDIQYARLLGLSSDLQASMVTGETGTDPVIKTPDDGTSGFMRFGVAAEDDTAGENRSFDLGAGFSFELTRQGNPVFLVDHSNGLYQLGAIPVPGSDSGLSYTYLEIDDTTNKITLQAPEGIVLPGYGYGNHAGTAAYNLAVDAGGNLIEVSATGGGYTNLTQFVDQNNWKVFYSDGSGDVQELSIGASGDVLTSNGTSAAPSWQTPSAGSGTVNSGLQYKAAYYITNPSGTVIDDWAGVSFGQTNINTEIILQTTTELGLKISGISAQAADYISIYNSSLIEIFELKANGNFNVATNVFRLNASNTRIDLCSDGTAGSSDLPVIIGALNAIPFQLYTATLGVVTSGGAGSYIVARSGTSGAEAYFGSEGTLGLFGTFTNHPLYLRTNNSNRGAITATGDFAFGSTSASRRVHITEDNTSNTAVTYVERLTHITSNTPGNGIGVGQEFEVETSSGNNEIGAVIDVVAIDTTAASEDFDYIIKLMAGGATAAEKLRVISTGELKIDLLNQDDSETKVVVWNSTDKILEWRDAATLGGGGGYTNLTQFVAQNNWKVFYSDGNGDVQELSIGATGDVLTSNGTAAAPSWETPSGGSITADNGLTMSTATNVQLGGTLLANTSIATTANYALTISGTTPAATASGLLIVTQTGAGIGINATASNVYAAIVGSNSSTGNGIEGSASNAYGVKGTGNSSGGGGVWGTSTSGVGVLGSSTDGYPVFASRTSANTTDVLGGLKIARAVASPANNIGISIDYLIATSTNNIGEISNQVVSQWVDKTHASRTSTMSLKGVLSATTVDLLILSGDGSVKLRPITATAASAITPAEGMLVFVDSTNGTFTAIGIWCYENGAWVKL